MPEDKGKEVPLKDEISGVFDVMTERLPRLISTLKDTLFSEQAGKEIGKAVGAFYKELLASGMDPDEIAALTRSYMSTLENVVRHESSGGASTITITRGKEKTSKGAQGGPHTGDSECC
jgi:hypothetical protein